MAVASTSTFKLNARGIVKAAYRLVRGLSEAPTALEETNALDHLNVIVKALQNDGFILRTLEPTTKTLTSGTASYALDSDTYDVVGPAMIVDSSNIETEVEPMSREDWVRITDKTEQGVPTRYYAQKQSTVTLYLWPVPGSDAPTLRYTRARVIRDLSGLDIDLDLDARWLKTVIYHLAHDLALASGYGEGRATYFMNLAKASEEDARSSDVETGNLQFYLGSC